MLRSTIVRVRIVAVGKLKESFWREAVDEYLARLRHYAEVSEVEVREGGDVAKALDKALPPRTRVVLLTIDGTQRSSEDLARFVDGCATRAEDLAFVIGGADGLPRAVLDAHRDRLSFGPMTLPHRLARLVLVEQLYRAMTIRRGEPYHH